MTFQNDEEPTEDEFTAFRTYTINNYKKMREEMGFKILMAEENGVNFFSGNSFNVPIGSSIYKAIDETQLSHST